MIKQLLYFDRYAKLAAPNLNVFSDVYLFDFLLTPAAAESGLDLSKIAKLLMTVQARLAEAAQTEKGPAESAPRRKRKVKVKAKSKKA